MPVDRCRAATAAVMLVLAGCASAPPPAADACRAPLKAMTQVDLYFGEVPEASWRAFLDVEVTPRFPDGLSVIDLRGQWKSTRTGTIARERSRRLTVIVPDAAQAAAERVEAIKAAFKQRFRQESVLHVERAVCAAF